MPLPSIFQYFDKLEPILEKCLKDLEKASSKTLEELEKEADSDEDAADLFNHVKLYAKAVEKHLREALKAVREI